MVCGEFISLIVLIIFALILKVACIVVAYWSGQDYDREFWIKVVILSGVEFTIVGIIFYMLIGLVQRGIIV